MINKYFVAGCVVWGTLFLVLFCLRPKSGLHEITMEIWDKKKKRSVLLVCGINILICTLPMGLSPTWNGENPEQRDQYERMAESVLHGHLYLEYDDIDPGLLEMENPYDTELREELGVSYHWDHAFYKGHYYMYFGVVPVFLLFLPFRAITGMSLTTYHATQVFVAFFIAGVFSVFYLLTRTFFKKITLGMYLLLSTAFGMMSVWYSVGAPALYCTAITAGLCMEIWSFYFFIRAVWAEEEEKRSIFLAFFGSLCGALAFGCRPPIALANLLVIPMLVAFLRNKTIDWKRIRRLIFAASPYFVVAVLLMAYNMARFENPFEFGQAYQLTVTDQSNYGEFWNRIRLTDLINGIRYNFISYSPVPEEFPYIYYNGALVSFPILCFSVFGLAPETVRAEIRERRMRFFVGTLFFLPILITIADIVWAPYLSERYRMDFYWLAGILCFLVTGFYYNSLSEQARRRFSFWMSLWGFATIGTSVLLFLAKNEGNYTMYFPEKLEDIKNILKLGRGVG